MSYIPPIIEVYQEFKAAGAVASDPNLTAVVVGPCYHILSYANNKSLIALADNYTGASLENKAIPAAKAGMKILKDSDVKIYMDDAVVEVVAQVSDGTFAPSSPLAANKINSASSNFLTSKVAVNDIVTISGGTAAGSAAPGAPSTPIDFVVTAVDSANTLALNKNLPYTGTTGVTAITVSVKRKVDDQLLASGASNYTVDKTAKTVSVLSSAVLSIDSLDRDVKSAKVYVEYKALDVTYANEPADIGSTDDVTNKLGLISNDDNPLAMGAFVTFSNAQTKIYALALDNFDPDDLDSSTNLTAWGNAVSEIKKRDLYAKAILSQEAGVISLFKVLEEANQDPKIAKYGISFGTHKVEDLAVLAVASGTTGVSLSDGSNIVLFKDMAEGVDFLAAGVAAGDSLKIGANIHIVDSVSSANQLTVTVATKFASADTGQTYAITRNLTNEALATRIANVSKSFAHKRVVMSFPDYCQISGTKVPGYYCACVAAGMVAGLPSNAGLTYKGAAVVEKVFNSNFKFDYEQLNTIAGGGTMIFMQDDPASLPYIRHQLTTDLTTTKTSEISVIKNNDYVSFKFKATMKKFLGIYNVQEGLFMMLTSALTGDIEDMSRKVSVELGPILISASITELKQSETNSDQVEAVIDTVQPAPFNRGILKIIA